MNQEPISNSKYYMLRCIIAMAHADGVVDASERAYAMALINRQVLTAEQRSTLIKDLHNENEIGDLMRHINDPLYRSQVLYFARLMAYKDGHLHPSEEEMLNKIYFLITDGIDMEALKDEVREAVQAQMQLHDIEMQNLRPTKGTHIIPWFEVFDESLLYMGVDLMDE